MKIPLALRIKKKVHLDIASAQDLIMEQVYNFFPKAVFHGGTAIWRCYEGNRFSEDLDFYLPNNENINNFFKHLKQKGFTILKQRTKENSFYSLVEFNRVQVRFEALFIKKIGILKEYELVNGNYITIYTLSVEDLLKEKINACIKRTKVRDLYDLFFLLRYAKEKPKQLELIKNVKIVDEDNIFTIILSGPIPSVKEMKEYIAKWEK